MKRNKKIIGITGNSGSGKSTISKIFEENKYYIIDADKIAHELMKKNTVLYFEVLKFFGTKILNENNEINRKELASIVFKDKKKLNFLNKTSHLYIYNKIYDIIENISKDIVYKFIIIDAPLLIESKLNLICDYVILVDASLSTKIKRIIKRDNLNFQEAMKRLKNQKNLNFYKNYSDFLIINENYDFNFLKEKINFIISKLK